MLLIPCFFSVQQVLQYFHSDLAGSFLDMRIISDMLVVSLLIALYWLSVVRRL